MTKKCSTDQRFIGKRNATYKIHTLVRILGRLKIPIEDRNRDMETITPGFEKLCTALGEDTDLPDLPMIKPLDKTYSPRHAAKTFS